MHTYWIITYRSKPLQEKSELSKLTMLDLTLMGYLGRKFNANKQDNRILLF